MKTLYFHLVIYIIFLNYFIHAQKEIKVGVLTPLHNEKFSYIIDYINLKAKMINCENKVRISLIYEDDGESKVKSLQNTIKLIEDKVDVIIGPSSSEVSYLATQYLSDYNYSFIPNIGFIQTSVIFKDTELYSNFYRTISPDDFQARATVSIMKLFDLRRCALIYSMEQYGLSIAKEFKRYSELFDFEVFDNVVTGDSRLDNDLTNIKERNYKVIFVVSLYNSVQDLLFSAYNKDMLGKSNFTWIFAESAVVEIADLCSHHCDKVCQKNSLGKLVNCKTYCVDCNKCDENPILDGCEKCKSKSVRELCKSLHGSLGIIPMSGRGKKWDKFLSQWSNRDSEECIESKEREVMLKYIYAPYVIDALDAIVEASLKCNDLPICKEGLDGLSFQGVTGLVELNISRNTPFDIVNLVYDEEHDILDIRTVGVWTDSNYINSVKEDGNVVPPDISYITDENCKDICNQTFVYAYPGYYNYDEERSNAYYCSCYITSEDGDEDLYDIIISNTDVQWSYDTVFPDDGTIRNLTYVNWDHFIVILFIILLGILFCLISMTAAIVIKYRYTPVMSYSSPYFLLLSLLGLAIFSSSILFWVGVPTDAICSLRVWFGFIGYCLVLIPLILKTWRVWRIFKPRKMLKKVTLTNMSLLKYGGLILLIPTVFLILWTAIDPLKKKIEYVAYINKYSYTCANRSQVWHLVLLFTVCIILMVMLFLSISTRNAPSSFSETYWLNLIYMLTIVVLILAIILGYSINSPVGINISVMVFILIESFIIWGFLYAPKLYIAIIKPSKNVPLKRGWNLKKTSK